jgi:hypothetical protein
MNSQKTKKIYCDPDSLVMHSWDVAKMFGVTEQTVNMWVFNKYIPVHKIGMSNFFNRQELEALIGGRKNTDEVGDFLAKALADHVKDKNAKRTLPKSVRELSVANENRIVS